MPMVSKKTVMTRVGEQTFDVPQVRGGGFYPSALEKGTRTEQALNLALAEMYVQGVSTRKVITVLQALLGPEVAISSTKSVAPPSSSMPAWPPGGKDHLAKPPMFSSTPATNACAKPAT